jgi:hypothetical protein
MEAQVTDPQVIQMSIATIVTIASSIVVALSGTIAVLFRMLEKKNDVTIELTKSFISTTLGLKSSLENNTKSLENNTKVMEKLPEEIAMYVKVNGKK